VRVEAATDLPNSHNCLIAVSQYQGGVWVGVRSGLREFRWLQLESGRAAHPYDAPTTAAYREHARQRGERLLAAHFARPPAKRPALAKLKLPTSVFEPDLSVLVAAPEVRATATAWAPVDPRPQRAATSNAALAAPAEAAIKRARSEPVPVPAPDLAHAGSQPWLLRGEVAVHALLDAVTTVRTADNTQALAFGDALPALQTAWSVGLQALTAQRAPGSHREVMAAVAQRASLAQALVLVEIALVRQQQRIIRVPSVGSTLRLVRARLDWALVVFRTAAACPSCMLSSTGCLREIAVCGPAPTVAAIAGNASTHAARTPCRHRCRSIPRHCV